MFFRLCCIALVLCGSLGSLGFAQEPPEGPQGLEPAPVPEAATPEGEEPTLPEVLVQPSEEPTASSVPSEGPGSPYDLWPGQ